MAGRLQGKVAIITGAGKGLGEATALRFAEEGAAVLVVDVDEAAAASVAKTITAAGGAAEAFAADVSDQASTEAMAAAALRSWGQVDVMYANAGITATGETVLSCSLEVWNRQIAVNLTGAFLSAKAVIGHMVERRSGSIIFQASGAAVLGVRGTAPYAAAKGGVISLTREVASDFGVYGIRSNCIAPGSIWTPLNQKNYEARVAAGMYKSVEEGVAISSARYPIPRFGDPRDNANLALFLASDESEWITGHVIPVDGGMTTSSGLVAHSEPVH